MPDYSKLAKGLTSLVKGSENTAPAVNRLDMNFKDVTKRVPELTDAANMVARGEMTASQYDSLVRKFKPVTPYDFVPQPATSDDAMRALTENKRPMFGKTGEMSAGEQADLRLDIPAYKDHGVWVNSIHRKDQPTMYGSTSSVKNATMIGAPDKALKVAQGGPKAPFAVIRGEWNPMDEAKAVKNAQKYLNHPDWKQVGYDPERHGFFYDRASMAPVVGADEVIQIGPLVLAKKPKYGKPEDFPFKKGGGAHMKTKQGAVRMQVGGLGTVAKLAAAEKVAPAAKVARGFTPKLLESTTSKMLDDILENNPKLTPEAAFKKAKEQAERKLTWERETKPDLVKQYGPLARASYEKTKVNKMQNTDEAVQKRIQKANDFLDQPTEPWTPPKPELQAFDRRSIQDALEGFPGITQTAFPRDVPTRASTSHVEGLYTDPVNRELIKKQIMRGLPLGGETFYGSLYPIKQAVLEAGMPAEKFDKWVHALAPASARNSIINETAVGQFLRDMNARGIPLTEENVAKEMAKYNQKFGVSLPLMPVHRQGVANVLEGGQDLREMSKANIPTNYKIPTYGTQKTGDFGKSVVLDVHEAAGQTQGSKYHPYFKEQGGFGNTEYNAGEQGMMGIADELGIPGGMAQAGRWFGGGELTGLKSPRGDALDILERQVAYTLKQQGRQANPANIRNEILNQIKTGEGQLLPWYKSEGIPDVREIGLQRKDGGTVNEQSFTQRLQSALEKHMAEGGSIDNTIPDRTDSGNITSSQFFANGGMAQIPVRSLRGLKPRRYADAGSVEPLGAPDYEVSKGNMAELAGRMIKDQVSKDATVLSTPEGRRDIALKVASHMPGMGMGGDLVSLVDWVQTLIPGMYNEKPTSVLESRKPPPAPYRDTRELQRVPKFPLRNAISSPTGEEFQEKFKGMGIQGENEAPIAEFIGSMLTPSALARLPKAPRAIEGGLNAVTAAARRPFTPATITTEAVAPDLAKFKPREFQDEVTKRMIGEGAAVPMTSMGGRKTTQRGGQGVYMNNESQLELNPMVGIDVPRAGNLSKNKSLRGDIATAGQELNQEAMAAHRFVPMATNNIKDATAMMVNGPNGRALSNEEVIALGKNIPGLIVSHSPRTGGVFLANDPYAKGDPMKKFLNAQAIAGEILGTKAKIQFGKADPNKDLMYMMRPDYATEGGRGTTQAAQAIRESLKRKDQTIPTVRN